MDYKFIPDLAAEFAMPKDGIMSRVLHKDESLNVTLFGFLDRPGVVNPLCPDTGSAVLSSGEKPTYDWAPTSSMESPGLSSIWRRCFLTAFLLKLQ